LIRTDSMVTIKKIRTFPDLRIPGPGGSKDGKRQGLFLAKKKSKIIAEFRASCIRTYCLR